VYVQTDSVYGFDKDGNVIANWPKYFKNVYGVVLGDIDGNDTIDIVAVSSDSIKVYDYQGNILHGWPQTVPANGYRFAGLPALGYVDNVDLPEVIMTGLPSAANIVYVKVFIFENDGTLRHEFTSQSSFEIPADEDIVLTGASIENVLATAGDEIVVSFGREPRSFYTEIFDSTGSQSVLEYGSNRIIAALTDLNGDDYADVVIGCADSEIRAYDAVSDTILWARQTERAINSSPAVGDIHPGFLFPGDEIAFGNDAGLLWILRGANGDDWDPWPVQVGGPLRTSPALANIDTTQGLDVIISSLDQYIYAYTYDGDTIAPFPLPLFSISSCPIIGDIDGDRRSEVILSSNNGYLHVWENRNSSVTTYSLEWPQFHHDQQRTGVYNW
jgi:hypothetical protein